MSLRLRQAIPGRPRLDSSSGLSAVATAKGAFFVYPSSSNVVLLDPDGDLHNTLQFWDALPHRAGSSGTVRDVVGVHCRGDMVVAWSGIHVVLWQRTDKSDWAIHSNVVASAPIASLDYRSGTIALGTEIGVEIWRTDMSEAVVVWDRVWTCRTPDTSPVVALPPENTHVAWYFKGGSVVTIQAFNASGAAADSQDIRQPRQIEWIGWRSVASGDAQLYIITASVLRIYAPVLDDMSWFQLLYSIGHTTFRGVEEVSTKGKSAAEAGTIFVPDAEVVKRAATSALAAAERDGSTLPPATQRTLEAIKQDELDVLCWFGPGGEVRLRSIVNLDRAPPTLIKSEKLASFTADADAAWSSHGCLLQSESTDALFLGFPASPTRREISTLRVNLVGALSSNGTSIQAANAAVDFETMPVLMANDIKGFVRTPNGRGLLAIGAGGEIGVWEKRRLGKMAHTGSKVNTAALVGKGQWQAPAMPILYAIYAKGRGIASYYDDAQHGPRVVLQHLDPGDSVPTEPVLMPHFKPKQGDTIKLLLALSDIDDGYSARKRRTRRAVIMVVAESGETWVWRIDPAPTSPREEFTQSPFSTPLRKASRLPETSPERSIRRRESSLSGIPVYHSEKPIVSLVSHSRLPVEDGKKPSFILPVDPMGWHSSTVDWETDTPLQDMVVTLSETGVLEFWRPRLGQHLAGENRSKIGDNCDGGNEAGWTRSGVVRTEKTNVSMARCSSRKKTVLICELDDGQNEMTIWDSNVSEFSTGLELAHTFEKGFTVNDLDWTTTADLQSVLAVGFPHHVVLVCEQRLSYVDVTPGWAPFLHIEMRKYTSVPISDSIWIAGGSLAVAAGNQIYIFSRFLSEPTPPGTPHDEDTDPDEPEDIFELIAYRNGPLVDYHPTMLLQCLLWDKIDLVKRILITLVKDLRKDEYEGRKRLKYHRLDPLAFHESNATTQQVKAAKTDYSSLFSVTPTASSELDDEFDEPLVQELVDRLDGPVSIPLTQLEKATLAALAQATLEVEESRRSLDICGLRYLISIRQFANRERIVLAHGADTPDKPHDPDLPNMPLPKAKISFRNIVWATHSESHQVLLQAATASCENNKMMMDDAKRLGVFLWLRSQDDIRNQLEVVARNRFMADEQRDPTSVSLIFFALGKKQVVHGLWRQAPGHKEQNMMLKFLANDFTTERWRTAALKNAYALLSKQRYEYAAAFFMLGGAVKDAITVCLRQMNDWQLAVAIARAVEGDGPLLRWILIDTVLPIAFGGGHRWLASWTLWMLGRRDLSVRVLVSPMEEIANAWDPNSKEPVGQPDNDDPSLLLLFQHLKSKTLQTAMGTSEVSPKLEFDFVLHNSRIFCRMGCHPLGLDLVRSWSFERPWFPPVKARPQPLKLENGAATPAPTSPTARLSTSPFTPRRRSSFMLSRPAGRENMKMDMDVVQEGGTEPPTRHSSPPPGKPDLFGNYTLSDKPKTARKPSSLMKDLRKDVQQGSAAFDMDQFFGNTKAPSIEVQKVDDVPDSPRVRNLMKEGKSDSTQGGADFSMDSFFGAPTDSPASGIATPKDALPPHKGASLMREAAVNASSLAGLDGQLDGPPPSQGVSPGSGTPVKAKANLMKDHVSDASQGGMEFDMGDFGKAGDSKDTRKDSKDGKDDKTPNNENPPEPDLPRKVGNLMKDVKSDAGQGNTEFNMDAFGF